MEGNVVIVNSAKYQRSFCFQFAKVLFLFNSAETEMSDVSSLVAKTART